MKLSTANRLSGLLTRRDYSGAERLLRAEAQKKNAVPQTLYNLAKVLIESGKTEQAGEWFRKALAMNPEYQAAWFEYGRWLWIRDPGKAARAFARAAEIDPSDRDALIGLGRAALRLGDWQQALEASNAVLSALEMDREALVIGYRAAAELRLPEAEVLRHRLKSDGGQQHYLKAITRVSKGRIALRGDHSPRI